ncbi:hypothetical protein [Methanocella paludicola]|nr:hypothetical protein [Methanocella paludicola]
MSDSETVKSDNEHLMPRSVFYGPFVDIQREAMTIAEAIHQEVNAPRSLVSVDDEQFAMIVGRLNDVYNQLEAIRADTEELADVVNDLKVKERKLYNFDR